jgi:energy-coupling factor transporter ATP-binding protein EcfA2
MTEEPKVDQLRLEDAGLQSAAFTTEVAGSGTLPSGVVAHEAATGEVVAPRIRRLWMRNFKGFQEFEIRLTDFNVLAGPNNSGKSTVLQAADLVFRLIGLHREGSGLATGRNVTPAILPVAQLRDLWYGQRYRAANRFVPAVLGVEFDGGGLIEFGIIGPFGAATSKVLENRGIEGAALDLIASRPAVWVPSSVGVVRDEEFRPAARIAGLIFAGRHNEVLRNVLWDLRRQGSPFDDLQALLESHFGGHLGDVHFDEALDQFVTATFAAKDVEHDVYSVGAGFLQVVQLLSFVLSRNPGLILLDEPDAHLHSSLQRTVVDVLDDLSKKKGIQVVLSTHSKEIINYVDPSRLVLVEKGARSASSASVAASQLTILQSLGEIDNVDAYALVKNKRCLFVEGPTDVPIIERLAAKLDVPDFSGDDRVVIIPVGGAERFEHVEQLNVLETLLGSEIASYEIRDRDGRTDESRTIDQAAATRPLHILERDSIESYLINAVVLARVVRKIAAENGRPVEVGPDDLQEVLLQETEKLRNSSIDRAADRYSKDTHRASHAFPSITEANRVAREFIESQWASLDDRLKVVPGKRLLGAARARLQADYGVSFGNPRLLEEFTESEVPSEIANLIRTASAAAGRNVQRT